MKGRILPCSPFLVFGLITVVLASCGKPSPHQDSISSSAEKTDAPGSRSFQVENAPRNPGDALGVVTKRSSFDDQLQLARKIVAQLSPQDLRRWANELSPTPVSKARDALLVAVLEKLATTAPNEAMLLALAVEPEASTRKLAKAVAEVWASSDFWALYKFSASVPQKALRDDLQRSAVAVWSDREPDGAFRYLAKLRFNDGGVMIWIAAKRLAQRNAEEAMTALDLVQDPRVWDTAAGRVFGAIAQDDLEGAVNLFFSQKDQKVEIPLAYALGATFAQNSASDGIDVLNRIQDESVANYFIHGMIQSLKPADMGPLLENISRIQNSTIRQNAAMGTGHDLAKTDPVRATQWIPTLVAEETRAQAYQGVGMGYAEKDGQSAQRWLNSLRPGKDRRYAIFGFASQYADRDPVVASNWAMTISEPDVRERLVTMVLRSWNHIDPAAAKLWAQRTGYQNLVPAN